MANNKARAFRATAAVTLVIFTSKGIGFIRDMISAAYFGTGFEYDAYVAAYGLFYLPILLLNSCITTTLIPIYIDARRNISRRTADRFASNCINLFALIALIVSALMMALTEPLTRLVYPGFAPDKLLLTARLTRIMMPSLMFNVVSIVMASILNARERYLSAQLTGYPLSAAVIAASVFFSGKYGIQAVAWGVFVSGILQVLILVLPLSGAMHYRPRVNPRDKRFHKLLTLACPAMLTMAVSELNHMIDHALASGLNEGDLASMNYAYKLITFATGVLVVPVTTVMFSKMSKRAAAHDKKGILEIVRQCIEVITMIMLPISVLGVVLSRDIISLVFMRGRFDTQSMLVTARVFMFYLFGILFFGLRDMFVRAFNSLQDTKTPLLMSFVTIAVNIVLNIVLSRVMGVGGLALATTVAGLIGAIGLLIQLRKHLGRLGLRATALDVGKDLLAGLACLCCALPLNALLPPATGAILLLRIALICAVSFGAYLGALYLLRAGQLRFLRSLVRR